MAERRSYDKTRGSQKPAPDNDRGRNFVSLDTNEHAAHDREGMNGYTT